MVDVVRTPDERFEDLAGYAFEPHYAMVTARSLPPVRMHYVEAGPPTARWSCCSTANRPGPTSTARSFRC